jgi:fumarylacetoacetate (FAA) hydrolase
VRLVTFAHPEHPHDPRPGFLLGETVIDIPRAQVWAQERLRLPAPKIWESLIEVLLGGVEARLGLENLSTALEVAAEQAPLTEQAPGIGQPLTAVTLYPPLPRPMSLRDFYAFEGHVRAANAQRGRPVPAEWYAAPVFYFSNPNAIYGPGETITPPAASQKLDYELEVACIIGRPGINIPAAAAESYIFGYTILNDWSARDLQAVEMRVGLGPAKGKDFATSLGPWIVTPDELADYHAGRPGVFHLRMKARVNGELRSHGRWSDLHFSFGEMIAQASADAYLLPGDVLGSGTVGSGCLLELTEGQGPWLAPGDLVELEIEQLGTLTNRVGAPRASSRPGG